MPRFKSDTRRTMGDMCVYKVSRQTATGLNMKERNKTDIVVLDDGLNDPVYRLRVTERLIQEHAIYDWQWHRTINEYSMRLYPDHEIVGVTFKHAADATVYRLSIQNA